MGYGDLQWRECFLVVGDLIGSAVSILSLDCEKKKSLKKGNAKALNIIVGMTHFELAMESSPPPPKPLKPIKEGL